jgi:GNAT superfamily N-acetyltransferase
MTDILVREFQPGDEAAFARLNEAWIRKFFRLEDKDRATLSNPQKYILERGGKIFVASVGEATVGCVALVAMDAYTHEVAKMAVYEGYQQRGIGRAVMNAGISWARNQGIRRLWLETNHILTAALKLYEASGFKYIPKEHWIQSPYERSDVQMELWLA